MNRHEELVEDSMFGEQFVTTAGEIREAREALIELGKDIARRKVDAEFNEAQIVFANANARMELAPPGDDEVTKAAEAANRRLLALFKKAGRRTRGYCSTVTASTRSAFAITTRRKADTHSSPMPSSPPLILRDRRRGRSQVAELPKTRACLPPQLLQLRVLGFGLLQDGDVGVGIFPRVRKSWSRCLTALIVVGELRPTRSDCAGCLRSCHPATIGTWRIALN
jgi:hypothetical protein